MGGAAGDLYRGRWVQAGEGTPGLGSITDPTSSSLLAPRHKPPPTVTWAASLSTSTYWAPVVSHILPGSVPVGGGGASPFWGHPWACLASSASPPSRPFQGAVLGFTGGPGFGVGAPCCPQLGRRAKQYPSLLRPIKPDLRVPHSALERDTQMTVKSQAGPLWAAQLGLQTTFTPPSSVTEQAQGQRPGRSPPSAFYLLGTSWPAVALRLQESSGGRRANRHSFHWSGRGSQCAPGPQAWHLPAKPTQG